ncbi:MAG TPA: TolC family protein [Myxococcales bacterium]|nr:TolC family protein [Myxococcales bacterium]
MFLLLAAALSLQEVRTLADQRNASLAASRAELGVARAGVDAAGQLSNPTLSISYGADDPHFTAGLDVKLPILGQRGAAIDSAGALTKVAEAELLAEKARLHAAVRRAYGALWAALEQARIAAGTAQLASELARLTAERFKTGGAPQLDVAQAQLAERRTMQELEDRRAEAEATRRELEAAAGVEVPEVQPPPEPQVPPAEALLLRAPGHPEVASLQSQEAAALARAHEESVSLRPLPVLTVTAEKFSDQTPTWGARVGVAFDLPMLSLNQGRIRQQEESARKAQLLAAAQVVKLRGQLAAARSRWAAASSRAAFYGGDFAGQAQRVVEMSETGYRIGRTSLLAVLQARTDLAAARGKAVDAVLEAQRALADLEEALGADL